MKLLRGSTFAHPVIAPFLDDVSENHFGFSEFSVNADGAHYHVTVAFELWNPGLLEYIEKHKAFYSLLMEARGFFYRKLHSPLPAGKHKISINGDNIAGQVDCIPLVIASEDIPSYQLPDLNDDYKNTVIAVRRGDVLAISDGRQFVAQKEYDTLKKLSSIMQVLPDPDVKPGCMDIGLDTDKISIYLCKEDHAKYSTLTKLPEGTTPLLQMIAVPALQEAIASLRSSGDSGGQRRWELALKKRMETIGIDVDESSTCDIACHLLQGPLQGALGSLDDLISGGDQ